MKKIPKTGKGKADRIRTKYQKKSGIDSTGVKGDRTKGYWSWSMKPTNPVYKSIKEDTKLMGGTIFKGGSVGGGFYDYTAVFSTHK